MDGSITTNKGIALISKLLASKGPLKITRVAVGDGTPPSNPATLNGLVHELKNANLESIDNPKNGEAKIVVTVSSVGVTVGFFIKEIGVFAEDTDGKEILYSYAGFSDNPQWIRPEGAAVTNVATYDLNTIVDRVSEVQVTIDPSSFATKEQLESLDGRISALEKQEHVKIYGVRWRKNASASAGERIYDSVGMVANVGTGAETVVNDFDSVYPFAGRRRCNGYRDADRTFHVTAYEGEPGYTTNDPTKLVYVETPLFYYFDGIDGDYEIKAVSAYPVPGFLPSPAHINPDGTVRQYAYSAAYLVAMEGETGSEKPSSRAGVFSDYNSLNGWATNIKKLGSQYTGMLIADQYVDTILMMVEFATKDMQTIMQGCTTLPYSDTHKALATENSVNRILITKAQAAGYVVGQAISLSVSAYHLDELAKNRTITAITDKSTEETYLYFDGAAVNIAVGNFVSSRPWVNGATDVVAASSGSPTDNTSGKYPCKYRGKENPYGNAWVNVADLLAVRKGSEDNYTYHMAYLPDPTKYAAGVVSEDYVELDYQMPGSDGYVKEWNVDERYPWIRMAKTLGASSTTYYADYYYYSRNAVSAVLAGGYLNGGRIAGPCHFYCYYAPSYSYWYRRARLS